MATIVVRAEVIVGAGVGVTAEVADKGAAEVAANSSQVVSNAN